MSLGCKSPNIRCCLPLQAKSNKQDYQTIDGTIVSTKLAVTGSSPILWGFVLNDPWNLLNKLSQLQIKWSLNNLSQLKIEFLHRRSAKKRQKEKYRRITLYPWSAEVQRCICESTQHWVHYPYSVHWWLIIFCADWVVFCGFISPLE